MRSLSSEFLPFAVFLCLILYPSDTYSQKSKLYVLVYKYKEGDKYRVTTSTYKSYSTSSRIYNSSFSGETTIDLYQEIEGADEEAYDMKIRTELTRHTENGRNLTYKMDNVIKGDEVQFSFDRFGKILEGTLQYQASDSSRAKKSEDLALISNIFVPLPDRALKTGDTWKVTEVFSAELLAHLAGSSYGIKAPDVNGIYTFESADAGIAKITLTLEVSGTGKLTELIDAPELDFLIQISGSFDFNITEGKVINGSLTTDAVGVTTIGTETIEFKGNASTAFSSEKYK